MINDNPHRTTSPQVSLRYGREVQPPTREQALAIATHEHYKGGLYRVICEATHTESGEKLVIREHVWPHAANTKARPADLFYGTLEDGRPRYRKLTKIVVKPYVPMFVDQGVSDLRNRVEIVESLDAVEQIDFIKSWLDDGSDGLRIGRPDLSIGIPLYAVRSGHWLTGPSDAMINELIGFIDSYDPTFDLNGRWPMVSFT